MPRKFFDLDRSLLLALLAFTPGCLPCARASTCTTQAQMTPAQRDTLASTARSIFAQVQTGNLQGLRANTLPAVAANFDGIVSSVDFLKPLVQPATVTVDEIYFLDAAGTPAASSTDFYCGSPVVVFHFTNLPPGNYALAFLHATGVPQPQQVSLILAQAPEDRWLLAGFYDRPMMSAGHDGLWYWLAARRYAQTNDKWDAWLYYHTASDLLDPVSFLSSPNLELLQQEANRTRPSNLPGEKPTTLTVNGESFTVTAIGTSNVANWLDLDVKYTPSPNEAFQLRDPQAARQQAISVMSALLELHPELQSAFHGIWVHAQQGTASLFGLELPMAAIVSAPRPTASESTPFAH
ncbi:MAG: hypothetical protein ACRD3N_18880 [Terracidiphilus sp.]